MAIFDDGVLGGFRGKIGTVEGYLRKGIPVLRSRRKKSKKNKIGSPKQKAARRRIKVVNAFIGTLTAFVRVGFGLQAADVSQTANNLAKSYQLLHSIQGEYPDLTIDYSKAVLAMGTLPMPENIQVSVIENELHFSWGCKSISGLAAEYRPGDDDGLLTTDRRCRIHYERCSPEFWS